MFVIEDFCFYWTHRILHHPIFYKKFHKVHHAEAEVTTFASADSHPFDVVFNNLSGAYASIIIFGSYAHVLSITLILSLIIFDGLDIHSGYSFPYSAFRLFESREGHNTFHYYHHFKNEGCYSKRISLWDNWFGTKKSF